MTAPSLSFPATRDLAALWASLRSWQPHALWVGTLFLHRVDALVRVAERVRADALARRALARLADHPEPDAAGLARQLGLAPALARTLLENLRRHEWATQDAAGWVVTPTGRRVAESGSWDRQRHTRRTFCFTDAADDGAGQFLALAPELSVPSAAPGPDWRFVPDWLDACLAAPAAWKRTHGFPEDVVHACRPSAPCPGCEVLPNWQRIILDRTERLPLAVTGGERCLGFALREGDSLLHRPEPVFSLSRDELARVLGTPLTFPPAADWRPAWETCRRPLGLPPGDVSDPRPTPQGPRVTVTLPAAAAERAKAAGGDLWLLAGAGAFRCAAVVELRAGR